MKIGIPKERREHESRVAATPETVKKYLGLGFEVAVETGAGVGASFTDQAYREAGATIAPDAKATLRDADIVLKVRSPLSPGEPGAEGLDELAAMKSGALLLAMLSPYNAKDRIAQLILERIFIPEVEEVDTLPDTARGAGGFGSTGAN